MEVRSKNRKRKWEWKKEKELTRHCKKSVAIPSFKELLFFFFFFFYFSINSRKAQKRVNDRKGQEDKGKRME